MGKYVIRYDVSGKGKGLIVVTPTGNEAPTITLADGTTLTGRKASDTGFSFDISEGGPSSYQWLFPISAEQAAGVKVTHSGVTSGSLNITPSTEYRIENGSLSGLSAAPSKSEGAGAFGGAGQSFYGPNGEVLATAPQFADYSKLNFERLTPGTADFTPIDGVDPIDVLGRATEVGAYNTDQITSNFARGREIASGNFDVTKEKVAEVNLFQREQAQDRLASSPEANRILTNSLRNLEAFSQGRASDPVLNEQMNANTRAMQAANSNAVGGGATSSFGNRVGNDLNLSQRLGLQKDAINVAPSFISNALEIRNGRQQNLEFDPMSIERAAQVLTSANTIDPAQALNFDFQNSANELNTQRFNAELDANEQRFNITNDFEAQRYNSQTQLEVDLRKLQAEQFQYSTIASLQNSAINATRADNRFNDLLGIQAQGIEAAQKSGNTAALSSAITGFLGTLATMGVGAGILGAIKGALGVGGDDTADAGNTQPTTGSTGSGGNGIDAPNTPADYRDIASERLTAAARIDIGNGRTLGETPQWDRVMSVYDRVYSDGKLTRQDVNEITEAINEAMQNKIPGAATYEPIARPSKKPNNDNSINDDIIDNLPVGSGGGSPDPGWEIGGQE